MLRRPFPYRLWRYAGLGMLVLIPVMLLLRASATGGIAQEEPMRFILIRGWLPFCLFFGLFFGMDWLLMRRFTWEVKPEGVHVQEHGATMRVVPWREITTLKTTPQGLVMACGKEHFRFSYLPRGEAERLLAQMQRLMHSSPSAA